MTQATQALEHAFLYPMRHSSLHADHPLARIAFDDLRVRHTPWNAPLHQAWTPRSTSSLRVGSAKHLWELRAVGFKPIGDDQQIRGLRQSRMCIVHQRSGHDFIPMSDAQPEGEFVDRVHGGGFPDGRVLTARETVPFIELDHLGFDVLHELVMHAFGMTAEDAPQALDGAFAGLADAHCGVEAVLVRQATRDGSRLCLRNFGVPERGVFSFAEFGAAGLAAEEADLVASVGFAHGELTVIRLGVGLTIGVGAGEAFQWGSWWVHTRESRVPLEAPACNWARVRSSHPTTKHWRRATSVRNRCKNRCRWTHFRWGNNNG